MKQAVSPAKSHTILGRFVCDHPAFGDIEFGHSIFSGRESPQESEEGNESYYDRSLRFNILSVMWLVSNSMFFTAEINGDSLRSLAMIWLCVAHEKRLVSYKFGTYFSCGNRCGLEIMGCNTDAWNDLEILGCSTRSTD